MERCPNCATLGRPGAKFCTTCGYRFDENDVDEAPLAAETLSATDVNEESANATAADVAIAGWPAAPEPGTSNGDQLWRPDPEAAPSNDAVVIQEETASVTWPRTEPSPWPSAPADNGGNNDSEWSANPVATPPEVFATAESPAVDESAHARARADELLDELRGVIASLGGEADFDLSGVISDLEVALEPPGPLNGEGLSDLREALLSARERPRDVDTIVDLTRRVDAVVALMFAYDRAIAAIERSLNVLRRPEDAPVAVQESD